MGELTENAGLFVEANKRSGVVAGSAFEEGGAHYRLNSGREFTLSLDECRSLPAGFPRWRLAHLLAPSDR